MKLNLKDYLYVENRISEKLCDEVVEDLQESRFVEHTWGGTNIKKENELSVCVDYVGDNPIQDEVWQVIQNYMNFIKTPWYSGWHGFTPVRFNKYAKNTTMAEHCDHIHSIFDGNIKGIPVLSVVGLLNDNYEGGDFVMFEDYKVSLKKGDVLVFPSNFLYPHKVTPVKKGTRYSFVSWVW